MIHTDEEYRKLLSENVLLKMSLRVAANQLEGVARCLNQHGQNIDVNFLIDYYTTVSETARKASE